MESSHDQVCAYAALILADGEQDISADNIKAVLKAAGVKGVPAYYPAIFEKAAGMGDVSEMVTKAGKVGGGGPAPAAGGAAAAAPAAAAAKEESEEEEDAAPAAGLFDEGGDDY